jgi:MFS family permease
MNKASKGSRVYLIAVVGLFSLGTGIIATVVPLFAGRVGGSHLDVGMLGLFYGIAYLASAIPSGLMADRLGTKTIMLAGMAFTLASYLGYSASSTIPHLGAARVLEGIGWATWWCSLEALTTHMATEKGSGRLMGFISTVYGSGFVGGSILAGLLSAGLGHGFAFRAALALSLLATVMFYGLVRIPRETHDEQAQASARQGTEAPRGLRALVPYIVAVLYSFAMHATMVLLPLYALGILGTETMVGVLMATFWFGRVVAFTTAGMMSDRHGSVPVLMFALGTAVVASVLVGTLTHGMAMIASAFALGVGLGSVFPACIALISRCVPAHRRGAATGVFETMVGVGMIVGPAAGGLVAQSLSPGVTYYVNALVMVPALFILARCLRERRGCPEI